MLTTSKTKRKNQLRRKKVLQARKMNQLLKRKFRIKKQNLLQLLPN